MTDGDAVVDQCFTGALRVPAIDIFSPNLELERRRHTIERKQAIVLAVLPVRVQIDEAGCHDLTAGFEHSRAPQWGCADRGDLAAADAHPADGVQTRFRIDHAAVRDYDVIGLV